MSTVYGCVNGVRGSLQGKCACHFHRVSEYGLRVCQWYMGVPTGQMCLPLSQGKWVRFTGVSMVYGGSLLDVTMMISTKGLSRVLSLILWTNSLMTIHLLRVRLTHIILYFILCNMIVCIAMFLLISCYFFNCCVFLKNHIAIFLMFLILHFNVFLNCTALWNSVKDSGHYW